MTKKIKNKPKNNKILISIAVLILLFISISLITFKIWITQSEKFMEETFISGEFNIEKGTPFKNIYSNILIKNNTPPLGFWYYYVKLNNFDRHIKYGYYEADNLSLKTFTNNITNGIQTLAKVTIPEGYNMYDIANIFDKTIIVDKQSLLAIFQDKSFVQKLTGSSYQSLEGFLAPGTYFFAKNSTPEKVAETMYKQFLKNLPYDFDKKTKDLGLSYYEAVILASIVQKETYSEEEAPIVASVFLNRLKQKMRLEADPTIIYGKYLEFDGNIKKTDMWDTSNRYNTYRHFGLPPTPISNPSKQTLYAVANPADTEYLFFVANKNGKHIFTKTYNEHLKNVKTHQKTGGD